jgi:aspartate/methionine/tyrosine aminotransferase
MQLNSVLDTVPSSGIREIFDLASSLEKQGRKLIRMDLGRPAFRPPEFVLDGVREALEKGLTTYTANRGLPALRHALAVKLLQENNVEYDSEREIIVTCGASEAVAVSMLTVLAPGAEALIPEPAWPHYVACARLAGAQAITVDTSFENGFRLTADLLERHVTPRTRLLVLNSPSNPTGAVQSREDLLEVLALALRHKLIVISDEIYETFVFKGKYQSFSALPGAREITILINGFSKSFAMTGWRIGYIAAPEALSLELNKVHQYMTVCATSFAQAGAVAALSNPQAAGFLAGVRQSVQELRNLFTTHAAAIRRIDVLPPDGAFYAFMRFPDWHSNSKELALKLLYEKGLASVPGAVFGGSFDKFLRLSFGACNPECMAEGMNRIAEFANGL